MRLRWQDVDLSQRRLKIHSPKTEHHKNGGVRFCPIFPELLPYLEDLANLAKENGASPSDLVIAVNRGSEAYFRTGFCRILTKAGIEPWPKLFQNMRASRETELLSKYPVKDVCAWIGNSQAVAMKHYAMVMDSTFAEAAGLDVESGGSTGGSTEVQKLPKGQNHGGSISDAQTLSEASTNNEKPLILLGQTHGSQQNQGFEEWAIQDSNL